MESKKKEAFPCDSETTVLRGMDLRDYFATQAMGCFLHFRRGEEPLELMAKYSYKMADAMMEERKATCSQAQKN